MKLGLCFVGLLLTCLQIGKSQSWDWIQPVSGTGLDIVQRIALDSSSGAVLASGTFEGAATLASVQLQAQAGKDAFIFKTDEAGNLLWTLVASGPLDEEVSALATDNQGNAYLCGAFWLQMELGGISLSASGSPRALFIAKVNPNGQVIWIHKIEGTGLKNITDLAVDETGQIYFGGYFAGALTIGNWQLTATGSTDLFLGSLNSEGLPQWAQRAGNTGDTRITALALDNILHKIIVGGFFNLTTTIGGTTLVANTYDRDVFVAAFGTDGQVQWVRKAGGVHDNELTDIAILPDENGAIYCTGHLVGVMSLGENISIQSSNGNPDFFILKYATTGTPLAARAMNSLEADQAVSVALSAQGVVLTGFFEGNMTIDGHSISAGANIAGFVGLFDTALQNIQLQALTATEGAVFPTQIIVVGSTPYYYIAGSFQGSLRWGSQTIAAQASSYDGFVGKLGSVFTGVAGTSPKEHQPLIHLYPQPASKILNIKTDTPLEAIKIYNMAGVLVLEKTNTGSFSVEKLPVGEYILFGIFKNGQMAISPLIVNR